MIERAASNLNAPWLRRLQNFLWFMSNSRANYWLSYTVDIASPIALAYLGSRQSGGFWTAIASIGAGLFAFTLIEYAFHRWLFHSPLSLFTPIHHDHHRAPEESTAMPFFSGPAALCLLWLPFCWLLGEAIGSFFVAGIGAGYVGYAVLHHVEHTAWIHHPRLRWLRKRYYGMHVVHHERAHLNYGVTTAFWDHAFGTHYLSRKRRASPSPLPVCE